MDIPVELSRILITELGDQQVIFLREIDGERNFPIVIGIAEALAIDRRIKGRSTPRPLTHELLGNVIDALDGTLERIVISDIRDQTFYATLYIRRGMELVKVDARPSDAIALGAAFETPLFVSEHVFDNVLSIPSTPAQRLELLRRRQEMLSQKISELAQILEDHSFLGDTPDEVIQEYQSHLNELKTEYDAIERVLRKLG